MNREIKFRVWHKEQGKMYSPTELGEDQLTLMPDGRGFANISGDKPSLSRIDNGNKMIPLQYTGLKDKNGKEIYEGDLLIHTSRNGQRPHPVIFHLPLAAWCGVYNLKYPLQDSELCEVEVVGNIYENPELLKEEK